MPRRPRPPEERFWEKVDQRGPNDCWPWNGHLTAGGYGLFRTGGTSAPRTTAHRFAYILTFGPIPKDQHVDHVKARGCTSRACCNPAHLEAVTCRENLLRGDTLQAANAVKTHCPQGHEYDLYNTRYDQQSRRCCRACDRARLRRN